jgi:hypothetical protein
LLKCLLTITFLQLNFAYFQIPKPKYDFTSRLFEINNKLKDSIKVSKNLNSWEVKNTTKSAACSLLAKKELS